jgi:hypothetical protein
MHSKQSLQESFAIALTDGLLLRYQEVPSAAFFAKEFNRRAPTRPISQESARRWLRGLAIPELDKLLVLRSWLSLDLNALAQPNIGLPEDNDIDAETQLLEQQKVFVETTKTIKGSLELLMKEIEHLERNLKPKIVS